MHRVLASGSANARTLSVEDLKPDWAQQTWRVVAPCRGTMDFQWVRTGVVASLGQLFLVLGTYFTAAEIYQFYRTLRIVAVKRRKQIKGQPASANTTATGTQPNVLSGTEIRKKLKGFEEQLLEEYAALRGLQLPPVEHVRDRRMIFEAAVQYVHVNLLQDLSPPWVGSDFSQALPGDGVLCRYMKPTFLRWDAKLVRSLFGELVGAKWTQVLHKVACKMAGIVARPLYVCTELQKYGQPCMAVASMSPLMQQKREHQHFRRTRCKTHWCCVSLWKRAFACLAVVCASAHRHRPRRDDAHGANARFGGGSTGGHGLGPRPQSTLGHFVPSSG